MKKLYIILICTAWVFSAQAQLPGYWGFLQQLTTNRDSVMASPYKREGVTGLVKVGLTDSILPTKTSTHQTRIFNWVLRTFAGLRWREIDGMKRSMVGTMRGGLSSPSKDFFTEYDVTFQTFQHTPEYQARVKVAYQAQYNKMLKGRNYLKKRSMFPDTLSSPAALAKLRIHPEHTPLKKNRPVLNEKFLPCIPGTTVENHPAWGVKDPTVGVYGAFVLDGNHRGGPEIHPYEWLWFMDHKPQKPNTVKWYAGLLREGSNRFLRWSKKPRVGFISIPFVFDISNDTNNIRVEHLVQGQFKPEALSKLGNFVPSTASTFEAYKLLTFSNAENSSNYTIKVFSSELKTDAVRWWINVEGQKGNLAWGYITIAVAVDDAYCLSVTTED